jgi:hypothetical protein
VAREKKERQHQADVDAAAMLKAQAMSDKDHKAADAAAAKAERARQAHDLAEQQAGARPWRHASL